MHDGCTWKTKVAPFGMVSRRDILEACLWPLGFNGGVPLALPRWDLPSVEECRDTSSALELVLQPSGTGCSSIGASHSLVCVTSTWQ